MLTEPPATEGETLERFRHVVWLARHPVFVELKRERDVLLGLESVRRWSQIS